MKKLLLISFIFLFSFNFVSSIELGFDGELGVNLIPEQPRNISMEYVNSSDFWDNLDTPADINAGDITDDGTYLTSTGDTGTGDYIFDGAITINEGGNDKDFRIEGLTEPNLLFVDASTDRIGIGTNTPSAGLDLIGNFQQTFNVIAGTGDTRGIIGTLPAGSVKGMHFGVTRTGSGDETGDTQGILFRLDQQGTGDKTNGAFLSFQAFQRWNGAGTNTVTTSSAIANFYGIFQNIGGGTTNFNVPVANFLSAGVKAVTGTKLKFDDFRHFEVKDSNAGTWEAGDFQYGLYIEGLNRASVGGGTDVGIALVGDGAGADILFGAEKDASIYWDGSWLNITNNLRINGNLNVSGCIQYNGGVLGTCV